ncbi:homogentisate solanesyltransferase, chloroplastic-like isoform X3 [Cucurbita maxima]|uniref:Homogentisate solanesyltransferase, chloroplastic-like isoform X3 n=1 Tax=Cucurbita maxima TaxID=3661 RepID=A0A6J1KSF4_CUCMA|nr:homogentisate solanesyltransferase, chloroplastic-like isoform X3 [Cucurbita maxima]
MAMASCLLRTVAAAAAADGSQSFNPTSYRKRKIAVKTLKSFQIPLPYCSPPHLLNPPLPEVRNQAMAKENGGSEEPKSQEIWDFARVLWTFLRPHTFYGTLVASCSLAVRVWTENPNLMKWSILTRAFCGLVELLCGNSYIVGINQIYDVEIDKVNKPFLPIAAGRITRKQAWVLTTSFLVIGLSTATFNSGPFLSSLYCFALLLGTLYTVPPFRLKRFPIAAFLCIALVRGFLVNFGVYYASRSVLGLPFQWSPPVIFITTFVTFFGLVIALTKDLSDIEGDRRYKIITFATKLGVRRLAFFGSGILLLNYVAAILAAIYMPQTIALDQAKYTKEAASSFYMFLWKLFYAEYLVFPFV